MNRKKTLLMAGLALIGLIVWIFTSGRHMPSIPHENHPVPVPEASVKPEPEPAETLDVRPDASIDSDAKLPSLPALTDKDLMGTSWSQGPVTMRFHDDGRWEMNGRTCAQWVIEGDRIKVFNPTLDEVHYIDIVDGTLSFNGETIHREIP